MLREAVFAVLGFAIALPGVALAAGDPTILIDAGDPDPLLLSQDLNQVQPNGTDPLTFDFLNDTGGIVTSFTFTTHINPGLNTVPTSFQFTPSGYFLTGAVEYNPIDPNGTLTFKFFGVNPPDNDEFTPGDDEANEKEGIPLNGTFHITLQGWVSGACSGGNDPCFGEQLYSGLPTFQNSFTATPEPSAWMLLGTAILGAGLAFRRRNRAAR